MLLAFSARVACVETAFLLQSPKTSATLESLTQLPRVQIGLNAAFTACLVTLFAVE